MNENQHLQKIVSECLNHPRYQTGMLAEALKVFLYGNKTIYDLNIEKKRAVYKKLSRLLESLESQPVSDRELYLRDLKSHALNVMERFENGYYN